MAVYVWIDGIEGTATQEEHKKWIQAETLNWGVGRSIAAMTGATQNRESSEPSVSEVTITKQTDGSSPKLFQRACGEDTKGTKVKIDFVTTGNPGVTYMRYTLHNTLIAGYDISTSGELPTETISFNFTKVEVKYTPHDEKNNPKQSSTVQYDLTTTKVS